MHCNIVKYARKNKGDTTSYEENFSFLLLKLALVAYTKTASMKKQVARKKVLIEKVLQELLQTMDNAIFIIT